MIGSIRLPHLGRWRARMTIQTRFMFYFGSVVVLLMAGVILLAGHRQFRTAMQQTELRGFVMAHSLAGLVSNALLNYDYRSLQEAADEIQEETGAAYVIILDKENTVAGYSGRPDLQGRWLTDPTSLEATDITAPMVQMHSGLSQDSHLENGNNILEVAVPVMVTGSDVSWGTVRVGLSLATMYADLNQTQRDLALIGFLAVVVVLISARFFSSRITVPLRELAEAAQLVASGKLDHTVSEDMVGELGAVAQSFNKMTGDLRRGRDAIRYQNQHLENMVQERTAALRDKARELERANEELKVVDRLKSDFLSNVSHELRTPLTSIRSFTEILLDSDSQIEPDERREFLEIVASQTDRLTRLISDLLDLSKIEAGELRCSMDRVLMGEMVLQPAIESIRAIAAESDVLLETNIPRDLDAGLGDPDRLEQVVINLLSNAIKFTPAGGKVSVHAWKSSSRVPTETVSDAFYGMISDTPESGEYVIVEVHDTGVGIAASDQELIFEKFGQVGNVLTNKPQGTGLGLTISASIMVQHGGAIWVRSAPGEGSSFYLSVPVAMENPGQETDQSPTLAQPTGIDELVSAVLEVAEGRRVLVVHDEEAAVQAVTRALEPHGFRAVGCTQIDRVVEQVRNLGTHAVILDLTMRNGRGYDTLRMLKADISTADIPVVVIGPDSEAQSARNLGATTLVAKRPPEESDASQLEPVA